MFYHYSGSYSRSSEGVNSKLVLLPQWKVHLFSFRSSQGVVVKKAFSGQRTAGGTHGFGAELLGFLENPRNSIVQLFLWSIPKAAISVCARVKNQTWQWAWRKLKRECILQVLLRYLELEIDISEHDQNTAYLFCLKWFLGFVSFTEHTLPKNARAGF